MNKFLQSLAIFFAAIPDALRPHRVWIAIAFVVTTAFLAFGLTKFQLDTSFDAWLSDEDPAVRALDNYRSQFGGDDGLFLVYRALDGDVFSTASLETLRALTAELEDWHLIDPQTIGISAEDLDNMDHVTRVQSLANIRYQVSFDDTLESRLLLPEVGEITRSVADETRLIAEAQPNLRLLMFSDNAEFGAIVLSTDFGAIPVEQAGAGDEIPDYGSDDLDLATSDFALEFDADAVEQTVEFQDTLPNTYIGFMDALKAIYGQPAYLDVFEFFPIGTAGMMDFSMETLTQAGILVMISMSIIMLLLYTLFHAGSAVVWPVVAIASSCVWVFGGMAWLNIPSTQLVSLTVMLVLAVGIADCVHVMSEYLFFKREGLDHARALSRSFEKTGVPILLTTITTMSGMMAIAFGGVGQFVTFGVTSALGVLAAFVFTIIILPVLLEFWHPHQAASAPRTGGLWRIARVATSPLRVIAYISGRLGVSWLLSAVWLQPLLDRVPQFAFRARYPIVVIFLGIFVICGYGATRVTIDSNLVELFKKDTPIRTAYEIVDEHMAGTGTMEVMLDFQRPDAFADYRVLQAVDRMQVDLKDRYARYVVRTASLADLVKSTNQTMNDDDPDFHTIPDNSLAVAQLLFLFNSSNPEDRRGIVSDDYSRSHVTVQLRNAGSHEYSIFFEDIEAIIAAHFEEIAADYPGFEVELTGSFALMMRMAAVISASQVRSLTLAVIIISSILILTLGSLQGGLLAIIPNMLPAVLAFGLMGLLGIPLDTDTLMIAPLIIGIAVDDTIHFVTHYRMALARGRSATESLIQTVKEVGQAVTFTSLVLGIAFAMLAFSNYLGIAKVGTFGSLAIFVALLCDLLFLPALIYIFQPKFGVKDVGEAHFGVKEPAE